MKNFSSIFSTLLILFPTSIIAQQTALQCAHSFGNHAFEYGVVIQIDPSDNVVVVGNFSSIIDFDPDTGVSSLTSVGPDDVFMAKYDPQGNFISVNQLACNGSMKV